MEFRAHLLLHPLIAGLQSWQDSFVYNEKTKNGIIMKAFILFVSLVFGVFAIAVYAYGLKHRTEELTDRSDKED